jgi:hypothetical protein
MKINWKIYFGMMTMFCVVMLLTVIFIIGSNPDATDLDLSLRDACIAVLVIGNGYSLLAAKQKTKN